MQRPLHRWTFLIALCAVGMSGAAAMAEELPKQKGVARTVKMFDMFCLTQLPDIEGIERFAGFGEFAQIVGDELAAYKSGAPEEKVLAWRFHDFGAELILTASRAKPDEALKEAHPAFAKGRSTGCALLFPSDAPPEDIVKELTSRMDRAPDESRDETGAHITAWNNVSPEGLGRVVFRAPADKRAKAILSASATVKN